MKGFAYDYKAGILSNAILKRMRDLNGNRGF